MQYVLGHPIFSVDPHCFINAYLYFFSVLIAQQVQTILVDCVQENLNWGLLDMYILLNENIVKFDANAQRLILRTFQRNKLPKFPYQYHADWLLQLLKAKCSVSNPMNCLYVYTAGEVIFALINFVFCPSKLIICKKNFRIYIWLIILFMLFTKIPL